jgi:hypothetical protein
MSSPVGVTSIAETVGVLPTGPSRDTPLPSGAHCPVSEFQLAIRAAATPSIEVNKPPANTSEPITASDSTVLSAPWPYGNQVVPSQRAILSAGAPPACVKLPPQMISPLGSAATA